VGSEKFSEGRKKGGGMRERLKVLFPTREDWPAVCAGKRNFKTV